MHEEADIRKRGGNNHESQERHVNDGNINNSSSSSGSNNDNNYNNSKNKNKNKKNIWEGFRLATPGRLPHDGKYSRDHSTKSVTDETFNTASHFMGFLLSFLGGAVLVVDSSVQGDVYKIISFLVYAIGLMGMFGSSTMHHACEGSDDLERLLLTIDYAAIFPLIAGTFSPLCVVVLGDSHIGWVFVSVLWVIAACGIAATFTASITFKEQLPKYLTNILYVSMGWFGALLAPSLLAKLPMGAIFLLVLGGVFYTGGAVIFTIEEPNPIKGVIGFHELWHIFVMLGAAAHYAIMFLYVLPYKY